MKTILITSKFDNDRHNYLSNVIDFSLIKYFEKMRYKILILPNSRLSPDLILKVNPSKVILSGGGNIYSKKDYEIRRIELEDRLIRFCIKQDIPLLGICRGMQKICNFFNIKISRIKNHVNVNHKIYLKNNKYIIRKSYHEFGITKKNIKNKFKILGYSNDGNIELISHKSKQIYGMMWHPERQSFREFKKDISLIKF